MTFLILVANMKQLGHLAQRERGLEQSPLPLWKLSVTFASLYLLYVIPIMMSLGKRLSQHSYNNVAVTLAQSVSWSLSRMSAAS